MKGLFALVFFAVSVWGLIYYIEKFDINSSETSTLSTQSGKISSQEVFVPVVLGQKEEEKKAVQFEADSDAIVTELQQDVKQKNPTKDEVEKVQKTGGNSSLATLKPQSFVPAIPPEQPRYMGKESASIKMYVFSSMTCGHCVHYHKEILPAIQKKYIDTGKLQFVYVDFPFDKRALSGAVLTRCAPIENYWSFLSLLFEKQSKWAFRDNTQEIIIQYAEANGMTKEGVQACLSNQTLAEAIIADRDAYRKKYDIKGTPTTVLVKGLQIKVVGGADLVAIEKAIKEME